MGRSNGRGSRRPTRSRRGNSLTGVVRVTDAGSFVETSEGEFRLTQRGLREAMPGDTVTISVVRNQKTGRRAVVESVIERATKVLVGTYDELPPLGVVRPLDTRIKHDFFVLPRDGSPREAGVRPGDVVAARIVSYPARNESGIATVERRIGEGDAPDVGIQCVMARYDLEDGYPQDAVNEAKGVSVEVEEALRDPLRRDLRDRFVLTIDPVDARDYDDAISVARTRDEGWKLGVHIADVSHYVPWGTTLDLEARRRSTSVYLADRVLPMLPEELSCDACSLRPDEDRLAFTVDMRLDRRGRLRDFTLFPSVIRSRVRMDYEAADVVLRAGIVEADGCDRSGKTLSNGHEASCVTAEDAVARARANCETARACGVDLRRFLLDADELARSRRAVRKARGSIDFETSEVHVLLDDAGLPVRVSCRERTAATSLVEEAMLLANECVARWLVDRGAQTAFRVHEEPSPDELTAAARVLGEIGVISRSDAAAIMVADPEAIESVLEAAHATPAAPLVNALLLRAMQRAVYRPHNVGHYALGASAYCHFTSPIRRYPDLLVHRTVKVMLAQERLGRKKAQPYERCHVGVGGESMQHVLPALCRHASARERIADAAAHASQKVKVAQYYASHIGERFSGTVSWIDTMGAFVRLDGTGAEGLVRMASLGGDEWWDYDEGHFCLVGSHSGSVIGLGARVIAEVVKTDSVRGHLDFKLVHHEGALH